MALIEINLNPSKRDLKWFGGLALVFFGVLGGLAYFGSSTATPAFVLWAIGLLFCLIYYAVRPLQLVLYRGWLKLFQPLGWLIAHTLFAFIYFVVFVVIGLCLRVVRYDPLRIRRDSDAKTYWAKHGAETDPARYFRQF
jgi:predicted membrane protein